MKITPIIDSVLAKGHVDQDEVWYQKEKFSYNSDDFREFCQWMMDTFPARRINIKETFPEYIIYFKYKSPNYLFDNIFKLRLLIGQGSCFTLYHIDEKELGRKKFHRVEP